MKAAQLFKLLSTAPSLFFSTYTLHHFTYNMPERMISDDRLPQNGTDGELQVPNRLILCFDGTGNNFQGNTSDTNIVKLLEMFDRSTAHQMHYYQRK